MNILTGNKKWIKKMRPYRKLNTVLIILLFNLNIGYSKTKVEKLADQWELATAKSIECNFPTGVIANWKEDKATIEKNKLGKLIFDNIDADGKKRARLIGNLGATDVYAISSAGGLTFIETTNFGYMNITSIFPEKMGKTRINGKPEKSNFLLSYAYKAVTSRHYYDFIFNVGPSQYYGYCRILE